MSTRFCALICLAGLFSGVGFAAKTCTPAPDAQFPSVDPAGNTTLDVLGQGTGQICINTKSLKLVAKVSGTTPNESNQKQNFKNDPVVNEFYGAGGVLFIKTSRFKVSAAGGCKLLLKGTYNPS